MLVLNFPGLFVQNNTSKNEKKVTRLRNKIEISKHSQFLLNNYLVLVDSSQLLHA